MRQGIMLQFSGFFGFTVGSQQITMLNKSIDQKTTQTFIIPTKGMTHTSYIIDLKITQPVKPFILGTT